MMLVRHDATTDSAAEWEAYWTAVLESYHRVTERLALGRCVNCGWQAIAAIDGHALCEGCEAMTRGEDDE